ncbi:MAG TPA: hypothetical protein VLV50_05935 [Stellaceae bacterium]|nr:hypothetical protein [Stellaceae bacterium]
MARAKKLKPATVRTIFKSTESAPKVAARFGVSTNLVYLIRQGKIHKKVTARLARPVRTTLRGRPSSIGSTNINIKVLADAIIDRLVARFFSSAIRQRLRAARQ